MKNDNFPRFGGDEVRLVALEDAGVVVLPIYYEAAVSYGRGAATGPRHILEASGQLEALDEETLIRWSDFPIHTLPPLSPCGDPEQAVEQMRNAAAAILDQDRFLLSLGGDHGISIGPIQAAAQRYPRMGVLQVDAHLDLRDNWNGSRYNHACVMRRVADDMKLPFVQVGIRAVAPEELIVLQERGLRPFFAHEIDPSDDTWIGEALCALPDIVYLTFDLDGLDPSVLPGTGTPEPDGLSFRQAVKLIRALGREKRVIAADITELAKVPGSQVSEFTAAKLAMKMMVSLPSW